MFGALTADVLSSYWSSCKVMFKPQDFSRRLYFT